MGWLEKVLDPFGIGAAIAHAAGVKTGEQKRMEQNAINDQIKAYKDQTQITKDEIARKRGEELTEKRRIEEKQIRSLRRNYSSRSLMGSAQPSSSLGNPATSQPDMQSKLGG
jgi:hypothetical protein